MPNLDLPEISYFEQKNTFTGSLKADFRFRVARGEDDTLSAAVWREDICFELAENKEEKSFPLCTEGLEQMTGWILALYAA